MQVNRKKIWLAFVLLAAFALWTWAVRCADVQPIGPNGSPVGMAAVNGFVHGWIGVHMELYTLTDWLGLVPVAMMAGFAALGLAQWVCRRSLGKVDRSILALGAFYLLVTAAYLLFEECVINYRPVLIDGRLEASYPSSTTLLVLCVIPTAIMQLRGRIRNRWLNHAVRASLIAFAVFMVVGRLVSGVHWVTDIIGGMLLSAGLMTGYAALCGKSE